LSQKKIKWRGRIRALPGHFVKRSFCNNLIFQKSLTPDILAPYAAFQIWPLNKQANCDPLLNVEYVLVLRAVRSAVFFFCVPVQVKNINLLETTHQRLAHTTKRRVV